MRILKIEPCAGASEGEMSFSAEAQLGKLEFSDDVMDALRQAFGEVHITPERDFVLIEDGNEMIMVFSTGRAIVRRAKSRVDAERRLTQLFGIVHGGK